MTSSEEIEELFHLPRSTAACDEGPQLFMRPHATELRYDSEDAQGQVAWTTIRFDGAFAVRVTPDPAVSRLQAKAYGRVCAVRNSSWIGQLRSNWREGHLGDDAQHFVVYFDHYGAVEVLATRFEVVGPNVEVPGAGPR